MPRAREISSHRHSAQEVFALVLLGLGSLLFLSLISYSPGDVPGWLPFGPGARTVRGTGNFIGPFGAIIACTFYTLLGAASFLVAALLLGYGGAKLLAPGLRLQRRGGWCVALVISGAALAHLLPWALVSASRLRIAGEGGWIGKWLGETLFATIFGTVGSAIVLGAVYLASLVFMVGLRPGEVLHRLRELPEQAGSRFRTWQEARAEEREALQAELDRAARERRKAEARGSNGRKATALPRAEFASPPELEPELPLTPDAEVEPEPPRPAPKIIDGTAPPPARPKLKEMPKKEKAASTTLAAVNCEDYELPSLDILDPIDTENRTAADPEELRYVQNIVIDTLAQFGIAVSPGDITRGPTITRYEVYPAKGVRVDRIVSLERDIARATRAERINILAPIPGKDTVGIEIANSKKQKVTLRELLDSDDFHNTKAKIPIALGKDVYGNTIIGDLAAMPHGLVAGTTGSGKSVCINAIIASILYRFTPQDLRFIMIDPKVVEMQIYNSLPHLVVPVVTDPKKVLLAMRWAIDEMERRYAIFAKTGVRNIGTFNARPKPKTQRELDMEKAQGDLFKLAEAKAAAAAAPAEEIVPEPEPEPAIIDEVLAPVDRQASADEVPTIDFENMSDEEIFNVAKPKNNAAPHAGEPSAPQTSQERIERMTKPKNSREDDLVIPDHMPYIVIIVDELADLMQTAPADVESAIARITQKARAAGIHMIIATQTPRADVITGVIKANVPCRIAFQVASALDSRVILDENGAERLLGQGDTLYRPPGTSKMIRAQGVLVTDDEIRRVVEHASSQGEPAFDDSINDRLSGASGEEEEEVSDEDEELVEKCIEVMRQEKKASTSLFQRRLRLGYTRAARILDILEMRGYVGAGEGAKPREILVDLDSMG